MRPLFLSLKFTSEEDLFCEQMLIAPFDRRNLKLHIFSTNVFRQGFSVLSSGFIAQLVRASHLYREVTGSNPVEVLKLSGFFTQVQKLRL